jgi:hypothetical protein
MIVVKSAAAAMSATTITRFRRRGDSGKTRMRVTIAPGGNRLATS